MGISPTKPASRRFARLHFGIVGAAVAIYAFLDDLFLGPVVVATAVFFPWYLTMGAATGVFTLVNIACCNWLQTRWDTWIRRQGARLEARLAKLREGRLLKYPARWITRDSDVWVTIASGLIGTVIVVTVIRLLGGTPIGQRRVLFASFAYSAGFAATYTGVGIGIHDLFRLL